MVEHNWNLCAAFIQYAAGLPAQKSSAGKGAGISVSSAAVGGSSRATAAYLAALLDVGPTVRCIEVVSALGDLVVLPAEFIQQFTSQCMRACERASDKVAQVPTTSRLTFLLRVPKPVHFLLLRFRVEWFGWCACWCRASSAKTAPHCNRCWWSCKPSASLFRG
jgi:hypothetical protein